MSTINMTTKRLKDALTWISIYENKEIVFMEFEDGSGNNFNYQVFGEKKKKFISWKTLCEGLGYNPDNLVVSVEK